MLEPKTHLLLVLLHRLQRDLEVRLGGQLGPAQHQVPGLLHPLQVGPLRPLQLPDLMCQNLDLCAWVCA